MAAITREDYESYKKYSEALESGEISERGVMAEIIGGVIAVAEAYEISAGMVVGILASTAPSQEDIYAELDKFEAEDVENLDADESEAAQA